MSHETTSASGAITFVVDNEPVQTSEHALSVGRILELSGNTPVESFYLIEFVRETAKQVRHDKMDELITIHPRQEFAAVFLGATPVS